MKSHRAFVLVAGSLVAAAMIATGYPQPAPNAPAAPASTQPTANRAVLPVSRPDGWWVKRNDSFNARAKLGDIRVVFLGDSITQGWEGAGKDVWAEHFEKMKAVNFGIGADNTQHLLYRIQNGNLDGLDKPIREGAAIPKLVVMMIGTNNSNKDDFTPQQIADGVKACIDATRQKLPQAKILLLAIFPRGEKPDAQREKLAATNSILKTFATPDAITFMDIGDKFIGEGGTISKEIMPDFIHLSPKGYEIWADAIEPTVKSLLGDK
jgi:lysophospholipase L1-like esterase